MGDPDVRHLLWLKEHLGEEVLDLVVVSTGRMPTDARTGWPSFPPRCSVPDVGQWYSRMRSNGIVDVVEHGGGVR
jgi:hypothetical protein